MPKVCDRCQGWEEEEECSGNIVAQYNFSPSTLISQATPDDEPLYNALFFRGDCCIACHSISSGTLIDLSPFAWKAGKVWDIFWTASRVCLNATQHMHWCFSMAYYANQCDWRFHVGSFQCLPRRDACHYGHRQRQRLGVLLSLMKKYYRVDSYTSACNTEHWHVLVAKDWKCWTLYSFMCHPESSILHLKSSVSLWAKRLLDYLIRVRATNDIEFRSERCCW